MRIRVGCELSFEFTQPTPLIAMLNVHFSRASDLELPDHLTTNPPVPIGSYRDSFGNWCSRLVAPPGLFTLGMNAIVRDPGTPDPIDLGCHAAHGGTTARRDAAVPAGQPLLRNRPIVR